MDWDACFKLLHPHCLLSQEDDRIINHNVKHYRSHVFFFNERLRPQLQELGGALTVDRVHQHTDVGDDGYLNELFHKLLVVQVSSIACTPSRLTLRATKEPEANMHIVFNLYVIRNQKYTQSIILPKKIRIKSEAVHWVNSSVSAQHLNKTEHVGKACDGPDGLQHRRGPSCLPGFGRSTGMHRRSDKRWWKALRGPLAHGTYEVTSTQGEWWWGDRENHGGQRVLGLQAHIHIQINTKSDSQLRRSASISRLVAYIPTSSFIMRPP